METKHYRLTEETKNYDGVTLHRIELIKDCKWGKAGEKGGWIEKENNLQGNAWVYGNASVSGNAWISCNAEVSGNAMVSGDAWVYNDAWVSGDACVSSNAEVSGNAMVSGGQWDKSPLQIQGSKHYFNVCDVGKIKIGCIVKTIEEWEKEFEQIGEEEGYTEEQIREYGLYIQLAKHIETKQITMKQKTAIELFVTNLLNIIVLSFIKLGNKSTNLGFQSKPKQGAHKASCFRLLT